MERRRGLIVACALAAATLLVHLFTNGQYGYFRDELYMLDCGEHLDWGYPDHPPLIALIAWFARRVLGGSLQAIRFLPALAGAAKVLLTGLIAMELGGGPFAIGLACLGVAVAPVYLGMDTILTLNAFEPLFWMGAAYLALLAINRERPHIWLWVGLVAGVGLENKHSMAFFLAALVAGLLLSAQRKILLSRWFWGGMAIALVLFLPNLIWQYRHDWATLELLENVRRTGKNVELAPLPFLVQQWQMMGPAGILVWGAGLWFVLRRQEFRFLGWAFLLILGLMMAMKGKNYYMAPAYPMLFAGGGVWWQQRTTRPWIRATVTGIVLAGGILLAPIMLPMLSPEKYIAYSKTLGLSIPKTEVEHAGPLPQFLGDMFGWQEMVDTVARLYHSLPADERVKTAILAGNFGEAGAINFFGPAYGLPKAISGHQAYYLWGPGDAKGEVLIMLQWPHRSAERMCATVEDGPAVGHPFSMREEHYRMLVCRGLKQPLRELWPKLKHWN